MYIYIYIYPYVSIYLSTYLSIYIIRTSQAIFQTSALKGSGINEGPLPSCLAL